MASLPGGTAAWRTGARWPGVRGGGESGRCQRPEGAAEADLGGGGTHTAAESGEGRPYHSYFCDKPCSIFPPSVIIKSAILVFSDRLVMPLKDRRID